LRRQTECDINIILDKFIDLQKLKPCMTLEFRNISMFNAIYINAKH